MFTFLVNIILKLRARFYFVYIFLKIHLRIDEVHEDPIADTKKRMTAISQYFCTYFFL
jgi:hypothetical protein